MKNYDVFCKGPFPDGRGGECWVRVAGLELPNNVDPRPHLSRYMCSVCGTAESVIRPYSFSNMIPWWDPDYRASIIAALDTPARIFPFIKVPPDDPRAHKQWEKNQNFAVLVAISPVLKTSVPERDITRRVMSHRARPAKVVKQRDDRLIVTV